MTMAQVKIVEIQFHSWDRSYFFSPTGFDLKVGDRAVVETSMGLEVGKIMGFGQVEETELEESLSLIKRLPTVSDLQVLTKQAEKKPDAIKTARDIVHELGLPMKIIDASFSFDDTRLVFAFTAGSKVDFRKLVRKLQGVFNRQIRLQQIGSRDVVAQNGGLGPCGRVACCATWLKELGNVNSDFIAVQQLEHRGSDRLSGLCGRLKCCLAYEAEGYQACGKKMPEIGAQIKTKNYGAGAVIARNILMHELTIKNQDGKKVNIPFGCKRVGCSGCVANKRAKDS